MNNGRLPTSPSTARGRVSNERATGPCRGTVRSTVGPSETSPDKRQRRRPEEKVSISDAGRVHRRPPPRSNTRHRPRHLPRRNRPVWGQTVTVGRPKTSKLPHFRAGRYVVAVVVSIIARVRAIVAIVGCGLRRDKTVTAGRTKKVKTPPFPHGPPRRRRHRPRRLPQRNRRHRPHRRPHRRSR